MSEVRRVVVITGAAGPIGRACAEAFSATGALVGAIDTARIDASPDRLAFTADVSDEGAMTSAFATIESELGPIDVLVQAAAIVEHRPFLEMSYTELDRVLAVNIRGVLVGAHLAVKSMVSNRRQGCLVNISSTSASTSVGSGVAYDASKGAVEGATRSLAVALAPWKIRANAIAPGSMATPQGQPTKALDDLDTYEQRRIPLQRHGAPEDVAYTALFLASPKSEYITGVVLAVDGGALAAW